MRQWHQGKEGFMKVTRIQDKYNPDKVWMIKRYLCGTFYVNQEIKVPTALTVIILSLILCPVCLLGLAAYYGVAIEWFMVFASFIAAFIVALVSMDGWERVTELAEKLIRKK